jgi:hypothetical protein
MVGHGLHDPLSFVSTIPWPYPITYHKLIISRNFNKIHVKIIKQCSCKIYGLQNEKNGMKYIYIYIYINDMSFLFMIF